MEIIFEHEDGQPIGSQMALYRNIVEDIKNASTHFHPPAPGFSSLEDVDLVNYELALDLGEPF